MSELSDDDHSAFDSLLAWVAQGDDTEPDLRKHAPLIGALQTDPRAAISQSQDRALVIGGAATIIEQAVLRSVGMTKGTITCVDQVTPQSGPDLGASDLDWRPGLYPDSVGNDDLPMVDVVVCLAASRLFPDAFATYRHALELVRPNGLVIIDFLHQPLVRRGSIGALATWALSQWHEDSALVLEVLRTYARLSMQIAEVMHESHIDVTADSAALGLSAGPIPAQQLVYETLFPLWYRDGATEEDVMRLIAWQLLYRSMDGTTDRIQAFADDCGLDVLNILALTPDTNVLIARRR